MKGIIISTSEATKPFLKDLLLSIEGAYLRQHPNTKKYPVIVVGNQTQNELVNIYNDWNGFELGAIARGAELFSEFVYLPDTMLIKDYGVFHKVFDTDGSVMMSPNYLSYIGKYDTDVLMRVGIPKINTKLEAVDNEFLWLNRYIDAEPEMHYLDEMIPSDTFVFEEIHGQKKMVNGCSWGLKYKGCWDRSMIK